MITRLYNLYTLRLNRKPFLNLAVLLCFLSFHDRIFNVSTRKLYCQHQKESNKVRQYQICTKEICLKTKSMKD